MESTLRTYCVIPHEARDDDFFDAVFEDGIRALYHGRLHSLFFSHVLSPAHDITGHVIAPLLARVRQGRNAALIVSLPEDENDSNNIDNDHYIHYSNNNINKSTSSNSGRNKKHNDSMDSIPTIGDDANGVFTSGEKLEVSLEIYANLLPLLFRSAERCCFARVSVVSFSIKRNTIYDVLQQCEVRGEGQLQYHLIEREGSSARWGNIIKLLHDRHTQLESKIIIGAATSSTLPQDSALAIRVELEGYGSIIIMEIGAGAAMLQQLTLQLRSGAAQTYAPRGPLRRVLKDITSPAALIHFVGFPDPQPAPRGTIRLLRCLSTLGNTRGEIHGKNTRYSGRIDNNITSGEEEEEEIIVGVREGCDNGGQCMPNPQPSQNLQKQQEQHLKHPYAWGGELLVDPSQYIRSLPVNHFPPAMKRETLGKDIARSTPLWDWGTTRQETSSNHAAVNLSSSNNNTNNNMDRPLQGAAFGISAVAEETSAVGTTSSQNSREQALVSRAAALDRTNRELTSALSAAKAEIKHLKELHESSQESLRQKQEALIALSTSSKKTREENLDYTKQMPKLLRKIKEIEKERDTLRETLKERETQSNEMQQTNHRLQDQVQRLQKELKTMEKKEILRLREHALNRIDIGEEERKKLRKSNKEISPKRSRSKSNKPQIEPKKNSINEGLKEGENGSTLLSAIAELRHRNTLLETELRKLRQSKSVISDTTKSAIEATGITLNTEETTLCNNCTTMKHHLHRLSEELERTHRDREQLQRLLADLSHLSSQHPIQTATTKTSSSIKKKTVVTSRDAFVIIASSIISGCESLRAQLEHLKAEASLRQSQNGLSNEQNNLPSNVFYEHMEAITALEAAVEDISSRRYKGTESYERFVPSSATAADAEQISSILSFEIERGSHLRAFVPTFAQLSVATEHLKMRMFPS